MAPLKVLSVLDVAKTQCYHFKAILIAGMGLFTDAYDFFCISPIMQLLGYVYYYEHNTSAPHDPKQPPIFSHQVPDVVTSILVAMPLLGAVIGQLVFGRLGDLVGRRRVYLLALMIMVFSSLCCGFSMGRCRTCILISLGLFRFSLGVGIGGDYPLSATIMSEFANRRTRGAFIAAVFCMQGFGILVSYIVTMVICAIFNAASGHPNHPAPETVDLAWKLMLMIGAVPAALTCYWRMMMPETPSNNLFQSRIYECNLNPHGKELNASDKAFRVATLQAIIAICSAIPGYFAAVYFIDRIGRVKIQMAGFLFMAIWLFSVAIRYYSWNHKNIGVGFMVLYGFFFFSSNFGPNTTTFIVPGELFPARLRTTCHGISGAAEKVGAIIGSVGFVLATRNGENIEGRMTGALVVLGIVSLIGCIITFLFTPETNG